MTSLEVKKVGLTLAMPFNRSGERRHGCPFLCSVKNFQTPFRPLVSPEVTSEVAHLGILEHTLGGNFYDKKLLFGPMPNMDPLDQMVWPPLKNRQTYLNI